MSTHSVNDQPASTDPYVIRRFLKSDSPAAFALAATLREMVFVDEQGFPLDKEQDEYDPEAHHWLVLHAETMEVLATARMASYQEGCQMRPVAKVGRFAISKSARGQRLGELLMREILAFSLAEGFAQAILDSQVQAMPFYAKCGFIAEGDEFMDAHVPHYRMRCVLRH